MIVTAPTSGTSRVGERRTSRRVRAGLQALVVPGALLATWAVVTAADLLPSRILPGPWDVVVSGWDFVFAERRSIISGVIPYEGAALLHLRASVMRLVGAFSLAAGVGIPFGLALGLYPRFTRYVDPLVQALRPIPIYAWLPLSIAWFGLGDGAARYLIFIGALFPIVISTADGVGRVPARYVERALVLGTPRRRLAWKVYLPASMPSILTGLRLGVSLGWMSVIIGELTGTRHGVGTMMFTARELGRLDRVVVGIICFALLGIVSDYLLRALFRPLTRWRPT